MKRLVRSLACLLTAAALAFAAGTVRAAEEPADLRHLQGLGEVRYHYLESKLLERGFHIFVRLPESYAEREADKFPTVYLLDGGITFPLLGAYYRYLSLAGEAPDMILVGISYGTADWRQGNLRGTDFTAPSTEREHYGGAARFQNVLRTELLPLIEGQYRSDAARIRWSCIEEGPGRASGRGYVIAGEHQLWWSPRDPAQQPSWQSRVVLGCEFFEEATRCAVPVDLRALRLLKRSPLALDIYSWLTYRMSYLRRPCLVPWDALRQQLGANYARPADFRVRFLRSLALVLQVYPSVRVREEGRGLWLFPSRSHVAPSNHPQPLALSRQPLSPPSDYRGHRPR